MKFSVREIHAISGLERPTIYGWYNRYIAPDAPPDGSGVRFDESEVCALRVLDSMIAAGKSLPDWHEVLGTVRKIDRGSKTQPRWLVMYGEGLSSMMLREPGDTQWVKRIADDARRFWPHVIIPISTIIKDTYTRLHELRAEQTKEEEAVRA